MTFRFTPVAILSVVCLVACSKKEPAPDANARPAAPAAVSVSAEGTPDAPPPPSAGAPPAPGADTAPPPGDPGPSTATNPSPADDRIVDDLQAALQAYYLANVGSSDRFTAPKTLDELVKKGFIKKIPAAPAGKKIVYRPENWQVTVENAGP
jgi:hypothetical protein